MLMFWWRSEATRQYAQGHIVAIGTTVEEARVNALTAFEPWLRRHHEWLLISPDEDDIEDLASYRARYEADIAAEPAGSGLALAISGSE